MQLLDPDLLEFYEGYLEPHSTGSSSVHPESIDGASHWFLYVNINVVTVVSHRHHFGPDFEP